VRHGTRPRSLLRVAVIVSVVALAAGSAVFAAEATTSIAFTARQAASQCQGTATDGPIFFSAPLRIAVQGNAAAVIYGNGHAAELCLTGTGITALSRSESINHSPMQVLASGADTSDSEIWSLIHTAQTVRRVTYITPSSVMSASSLTHGLWLLSARQALSQIYGFAATNGPNAAGVLVAFDRSGLVVSSFPLRLCKFESMMQNGNPDRCP